MESSLGRLLVFSLKEANVYQSSMKALISSLTRSTVTMSRRSFSTRLGGLAVFITEGCSMRMLRGIGEDNQKGIRRMMQDRGRESGIKTFNFLFVISWCGSGV